MNGRGKRTCHSTGWFWHVPFGSSCFSTGYGDSGPTHPSVHPSIHPASAIKQSLPCFSWACSDALECGNIPCLVSFSCLRHPFCPFENWNKCSFIKSSFVIQSRCRRLSASNTLQCVNVIWMDETSARLVFSSLNWINPTLLCEFNVNPFAQLGII